MPSQHNLKPAVCYSLKNWVGCGSSGCSVMGRGYVTGDAFQVAWTLGDLDQSGGLTCCVAGLEGACPRSEAPRVRALLASLNSSPGTFCRCLCHQGLPLLQNKLDSWLWGNWFSFQRPGA